MDREALAKQLEDEHKVRRAMNYAAWAIGLPLCFWVGYSGSWWWLGPVLILQTFVSILAGVVVQARLDRRTVQQVWRGY